MRARAVLLALFVLSCAPASAQSLSADLAINFVCPAPPSEKAIEGFLAAHGFHVANEERVRRQLGLGFFPLEIEALDSRRWTVTFRGLIGADGNRSWTPQTVYTAGIYSSPPTHHDDALESDVGGLVTTSLRCTITSRNRGDNAADAVTYFDHIYNIQASRMHEADVCDKTLASYDAKLCAKVPGH